MPVTAMGWDTRGSFIRKVIADNAAGREDGLSLEEAQ